MEPEILAFRRERRFLDWTNRVFFATSILCIGWVVWAIMIAERRDAFYVLPSLFGMMTGFSRYFVHRVKAMPQPVRDLRSPDPAVADRAWQVVEAHRGELLGATVVFATTREPPLVELDRAALLQRLERAGAVDWRRVLRIWLCVWVPLAIVVLVATVAYVPDPTHSY